MRFGGLKNPGVWKKFGLSEDVKLGGDQIEYEDEEPEIRRLFEEELAKEGLQSKM
jgi:hypothetical protein